MSTYIEKHVVRFDYWLDPIYDQIMSQASGINAVTCAMDGPDYHAWEHLERAHVYQITGVRDDLPKRWFAMDELLARCPDLLLVSSNGSGCDTIDLDACTRAGVAVVNQAGGNADSVAEMTLGLMLAVYRRISESDRFLRSHKGFSREDLMGHEMRGRTIGLVGVGQVGQRVAMLAKAFGMRVLGFDPAFNDVELEKRGVEPASFDKLLSLADVVSLHCPRNLKTFGMMGAAEFNSMRPGALFISTARGGIHDEVALYDALLSGHLGGAGIDVWATEPPPTDHPLLSLQQVVATFHTAGVTHEARRKNASMAATQIVEYLTTGARPPRLMNPAVWPLAEQRIRLVLDCAVAD